MVIADPLARWLAFYDALERAYNARDHPAFNLAFRALADHDHTLTARERVAARIARWRRDAPAMPLPEATERAWWGHCLCRACTLARSAPAGGTLAPWQRQQHTLTTQRKKRHTHVWNDHG